MRGDAFTVDIREFERELRELGRSGPIVMARALNRAGKAGQTAMSRAAAKDIGLSQKYARRQIKVDRATRTQPRFAFQITGRRIPLIAFDARGPEPSKGKGRGVSYRKQGRRVRIREAFIARVGIGAHRGVFGRKSHLTRKSVGAWGPNLPIKELFGPSLPHVFEKHIPVFRKAAEPSLIKNLRSEIAFARRQNEGA